MLNLVKVNFHYYLCRRLGGGMEISIMYNAEILRR